MAQAAAQTQAQAATTESSLLDQIVVQSKVARSDSEHSRAKDIIGEMLNDGILEEGIMFNRKVLLVTERENDDFTW